MMPNPDFSSKTDEELVKLTLENQYNFLHLVNRYERKLLAFILRISNVSVDEAKDLLQEIFIKVYKNLNGFDQRLKFSSWIYRIARNHVISHHRKNKNKAQSLFFEFNEGALESIASEFNISREIDHQFLEQRIAEALNQVDLKYREIIILRFFEGRNYQEISDIVKKPAGTVATWLSRGKKQFKECFKYEQ